VIYCYNNVLYDHQCAYICLSAQLNSATMSTFPTTINVLNNRIAQDDEDSETVVATIVLFVVVVILLLIIIFGAATIYFKRRLVKIESTIIQKLFVVLPPCINGKGYNTIYALVLVIIVCTCEHNKKKNVSFCRSVQKNFASS